MTGHSRSHAPRFWRSLAAAGFAVVLLGLGVAVPAQAATTDLSVNVRSAKTSYLAGEDLSFTVEVTSRGPAALTAPAEVRLDVPPAQFTTEQWNESVTCVASNGAVCPTSYTLEDDAAVLVGAIPQLPPLGTIVLTATVADPGGRFATVSRAISAVVNVAGDDVDPELETNHAATTIEMLAPHVDWSVDLDGPATLPAPGGTTATYTVTLTNAGENDTGLYSLTSLAPRPGQDTFSGLDVTQVRCVGTTGDAGCADAIEVDTSRYPPAIGELSGGGTTSFGVRRLPGRSSITFELDLEVGTSACLADADGYRTIEVTTTLQPLPNWWNIPGITGSEIGGTSSDNTAAATTNVGAFACGRADLSVASLTQSTTQATSGLNAASPFEYQTVFANDSTSAADGVGSPLAVTIHWPSTGASLGPVQCLASGGAVCPAEWSTTVVGSGADTRMVISAPAGTFPPGGTLQVTARGTTGSERTDVCRPRRVDVEATFTPGSRIHDDNYDTDDPTWGNNRGSLSTQANVGDPCGQSHDDAVAIEGPFTDSAATTLLVGPAHPGQALYFRSTFTNIQSTPAQTFDTFRHTVDVAYPFAFNPLWQWITHGFSPGDPGDPANRWQMSYQPGDPVSLPATTTVWSDSVPLPSGVRCVAATGGAPCPVAVTGGLSGGGGAGYYYTSGFTASSEDVPTWAAPNPVMPDGSTLEFISTYRVPPLNASSTNGTCIPVESDVMASQAAIATVSASTTPPSGDRNTANDRASAEFAVLIKACDRSLAATKHVLASDGETLLDTDTLRPDRAVTFDLTLTNTSASPLDLPHLYDHSFQAMKVESSEFTCTSQGGAQCPDFIPQPGVRHLADGTTAPITDGGLYDFVWGRAGEPTMPPGSSVTFRVALTFEHSAEVSGVYNQLQFTADPSSTTGLWPRVLASARVTVPDGSSLGLVKHVTPTSPRPGERVTFTVDLFNPTAGAATDVYYYDAMHEVLQAVNPDGFADLTCRALTPQDGVLTPNAEVTEVACPEFTSDPTGFSATLALLPPNSGLRLTYTAIAPSTSATAPNIARLTHSDVLLTQGDAAAHANLSVLALQLAGTVWHDADASASGTFTGIRTGEEEGTDGDGLLAVLVDAVTGSVLATSEVAGDGSFEFTGVAPGIDVDVLVVPATQAPQVGESPPQPGVNPGWRATTPLLRTLNTGVYDTLELDFGLLRPSRIGDLVWQDTDGDGV